MGHRNKILFLVNGDYKSAFGIRTRGLTSNFSVFKIKIVYRHNKIASIFKFIIQALIYKPDIIYLMNIASSGAIACLALKIFFNKSFVADTGDVTYELFKVAGSGKIVCFLAKIIEDYVLRLSNIIIVRGRYLKSYLEKRGYKNIYYIPEGVDISKFKPMDVTRLKKKIAPENELVIGVLGKLVWVRTLDLCYGWDIVEALNIMKDKPIKAVIIGDGDGKERLEKRAKEYGISGKIVFVGWLVVDKLSEYINVMDVCLSTQTNDVIGWTRTAAKLPLYLACGKYILATDVGEAHHILPDKMRLYYNGKKDLGYPKRLVKALQEILSNKKLLEEGIKNREIALQNFDYRMLSKKLENILLSNYPMS